MFSKLINKLKGGIVIATMLTLTACGGGGGGSSLVSSPGGTGGTTPPTTATYKITLSTDKTSLNAGGTANLTASVTDASGAAVDGATVSFAFGSKLSNGTLSANSATTAAGSASVRYTAGTQSGTDTIIATVTDTNGKTVQSAVSIAVTASDATACKNVAYSGTGATVLSSFTNISGPTTFTMSYKGSGNFIVNLKDATGNNVALLANEIGDVVNRQQSVTLDVTKTYFIAVEEGLGQWTIAVNNPSCTSAPDTVGFVQILTSTGQVDTNSSAGTDVTVIVKSPTNVLMPNVPVTLSASDGNITPPAGGFVTAANGAVTAKLDTQGLYKNGTITLNASAGGVNATRATVNVSGTKIAINGPSAGTAGNNLSYALLLQDSNNKPISGQSVNLTSTVGIVTPGSVVTDANGQAPFSLSATANTTLTANATDLNTTGSLDVKVAQVAVNFTKPAVDYDAQNPNAGSILAISPSNQPPPHPFIVKVTDGGNAVMGQIVNFATTRGNLSSNTALTDNNGDATIYLGSSTAGPAIVTATYGAVSASRIVAFTASTATQVIVQATPSTVAPNNSSTITAKLMDSNGNSVVGKNVTFTTDDTSGGAFTSPTAITDEQGVATTTFTAGNGTSPNFTITATDTADNINGTTKMNVANKTAFVTIGTDNLIAKSAPNYQKTYSVIVTDINGRPMTDQPVNIYLYSTAYALGDWSFDPAAGKWVQNVNNPPGTCTTNDTNHDGVLNPTETAVVSATRGNVIAPGNVATFSPAQPRTDQNGIATITVTYPQNYASWVKVYLSATTTVLGTANTSALNFWLPVSADDVTSQSGPAAQTNPLGNGASCFAIN
ncbi:Ig-like domain-containing protein [Halothiobacillus sp.]|uniref:beta strand repeat-containing protein n=1 Tax=Halothiobacillus sp. TaxID=1891311 RepID=UPI0026227CB3|nr:Ig-like domain-containing protein [Halothiobacillus sp.]